MFRSGIATLAVGASALLTTTNFAEVAESAAARAAATGQGRRAQMQAFLKSFDGGTMVDLDSAVRAGLESYHEHAAFDGYARFPDSPRCPTGGSADEHFETVKALGGEFPGGPELGSGLSEAVGLIDIAAAASGPVGAQSAALAALAQQGAELGESLVQQAAAQAIQVVPLGIAPPLWNNRPLTCGPLVGSSHCGGAVLHPITMADIVMSSVTDGMLDAYVLGFATTYSSKVGQTTDGAYKTCFGSYMSLMCASAFPRCGTQQSGQEAGPTGRLPTCFYLCVSTLVLCPGFWLNDIMPACSNVSVPPMCSMAVYWDTDAAPKQIAPEVTTYPRDCPALAGSLL